MVSIKWEVGTDSNVLTTELNSLANAGQKISAEIDNSADLYLFDDVEWHNNTLASAAATGAVIELYQILIELDGTGYEDGNDSTAPPPANLVGVFNLRTVATAQTHIIRQVPLPPSRFKYLVINKSGQALNATGNTLRRKPYRYQTV